MICGPLTLLAISSVQNIGVGQIAGWGRKSSGLRWGWRRSGDLGGGWGILCGEDV